jgi:hypothetical protein
MGTNIISIEAMAVSIVRMRSVYVMPNHGLCIHANAEAGDVPWQRGGVHDGHQRNDPRWQRRIEDHVPVEKGPEGGVNDTTLHMANDCTGGGDVHPFGIEADHHLRVPGTLLSGLDGLHKPSHTTGMQ